ncbi:acetyl-CoA carboxylase biotin carboxyl carrier protein [Amycolatopsis samaneae]|uniref:Biotin carboxyl carrier protein of acetyl-CoA carboxylase n=1 Tax=Amycolatopsis samaneae TaxID=664691 RepID=A0ABW5GS47_9PSEU
MTDVGLSPGTGDVPGDWDYARDLVFAQPAASAVRAVLREAADTVATLLTSGPAPARLSVRAGEVAIEVSWPDRTAVPAGPAPTSTVDTMDTADTADTVAERPGPDVTVVTASTVGVFYRAPSPEADPYVREGDHVRQGQQVGIVEAMKLMIPVEADRAGTVVRILRDNGDEVEYGDALMELGAP